MSPYRLLVRAFHRFTLLSGRTSTSSATSTSSSQCLLTKPHIQNPYTCTPIRCFALASAEEAAAERRRRKRQLRLKPPTLNNHHHTPRPPPDPNAPRLPDTTANLTGPRLAVHNRVQSLHRAGDLENASHVARQSCYSRIRPTVFTCNALIAALHKNKRYDDVVAHFHFFFRQIDIVPNVVSYNYLINTHCDCGRVDEALELYREILEDRPYQPSSVTFKHLTKGLIDAGRIDEAVELKTEMISRGLGADSHVFNNLIKGFLDLDNLEKSNEILDDLKERCAVYDGVVHATFMNWFFRKGRDKEAMDSYRSFLDRKFRLHPPTGNVLLECLMKHNRKKEAHSLFETMLDNHQPPNTQGLNSDTFNIMVNDCFKLGKYDEAVATFRKAGTNAKSRPFAMDVAGYTNMVVRFCEHGMISEAEKFFEELRSKSLSTDITGFRTLIDAYCSERRIDDAVNMFNLMVDAGLRVIPAYANRWLSILIENGKAVEASQILKKLGEKDPRPDATTYEIVIRGLGVDKWDEIRNMINDLMGYGVGATSALQQFLYETCGDRRDEIERLLDERRLGFNMHSQPPPRPGLLGPFESAKKVPTGPFTGIPSKTASPILQYSQNPNFPSQQKLQQEEHQPQASQSQWNQLPPQPQASQGQWNQQPPQASQRQWNQQPPQPQAPQGQWNQQPPQPQAPQGQWNQHPPHHPQTSQGQWSHQPHHHQPSHTQQTDQPHNAQPLYQHHGQAFTDQRQFYQPNSQRQLQVHHQHHPNAFQGQQNQYTQNYQPEVQQHFRHAGEQQYPKSCQDQGYHYTKNSQPSGKDPQEEMPELNDNQAFQGQWERQAFRS